MKKGPVPSVVCFGEILWDLLPGGAFPGGAPFNVAYHLKRLGLDPRLVSAVGRDRLGDELLARLQRWGIETDGISVHLDLPTGSVRATVSSSGDARYDIATNVAWDRILSSDSTDRAVRGASALVFGSLAQRCAFNVAALSRLLSMLPVKAARVFDINLRAPHDDLAFVLNVLPHVTLLKLNADEAAQLVAKLSHLDAPVTPPSATAEERWARALGDWCGKRDVLITAGARGAGLLEDGQWYWESGRQVEVRDTVGAGDAFLAAFLDGYLRNLDPATTLSSACRLGEWVASQPGATPEYVDHVRTGKSSR